MLLLFGLLFSACAPSQSSPVASDPGKATLSINQNRVIFSAGLLDASQVTLNVAGGLRVADLQPCLQQFGEIVCTLGNVQPGEAKTLTFINLQAVQATYLRRDGTTYTLSAP